MFKFWNLYLFIAILQGGFALLHSQVLCQLRHQVTAKDTIDVWLEIVNYVATVVES